VPQGPPLALGAVFVVAMPAATASLECYRQQQRPSRGGGLRTRSVELGDTMKSAFAWLQGD
jgi:hypothetical protein